jgi:hypothetical protein
MNYTAKSLTHTADEHDVKQQYAHFTAESKVKQT